MRAWAKGVNKPPAGVVEPSITAPDADADAVVIRQILAGEQDAYEVIVKKYQGRAYRAALGWVGNVEDALDLSQEAFIKAFRALRRYDCARPFFAWFYVILRNTCFNFLRRRKRERTVCLDFAPVEAVASDDEARQAEIKRQVWRAIAQLSDEAREVMVLKYFEEMSYRDIADAVGIPIGTVMSRLYYGRKKLQKALESYYRA